MIKTNQGMIPKDAQSLPQSVKKMWLLINLLGLAVILIVAVVINIFLKFDWQNPILLGLNGVVGILLIIAIVDIVLIPYNYHFYKYILNEDAISVYKGFFLRKSETIPLNRIQNVDTRQGPILRLFHLHNIVIVTAANAFKIEGISEDVAQYLRAQLISAARQAREVETDE